MLESDPGIEVVGTALNGVFGLRKTVTLNPDVVVLDLEMPDLDGVGYLQKRKENGWDVPVVILSAVAKKGAEVTMRALSLGASDFITKPSGTPDANRDTAEQLISMVKGFGSAYRKKKVHLDGSVYKPEPILPKPAVPAPRATAEKDRPLTRLEDWPQQIPKRPPAPPQIIAIGISTGGPNALRRVFANLNPEMNVPIVVVQHMPAGFTAEFANSLNKICPLEVKEAAEGDLIKPGRILIAPGDRHVRVEKKSLATIARLGDEENVNGHKPSVGVLFDSVAEHFGNAAIAIIMTGMGRDGSREIGSIYAEGSVTIAQDEESSVVYGMPRVATEHNYIGKVVSLDDMATTINELTSR